MYSIKTQERWMEVRVFILSLLSYQKIECLLLSLIELLWNHSEMLACLLTRDSLFCHSSEIFMEYFSWGFGWADPWLRLNQEKAFDTNTCCCLGWRGQGGRSSTEAVFPSKDIMVEQQRCSFGAFIILLNTAPEVGDTNDLNNITVATKFTKLICSLMFPIQTQRLLPATIKIRQRRTHGHLQTNSCQV